MKYITLTYNQATYFINCDKIHFVSKHGDVTWINLGSEQLEFRVDQTPEEIMEQINGGNK
jgi:hypothetical protein